MKLTRRALGHSLLRSLVGSHRSLICLLRTARFARASRRAHSLARLVNRLRTQGKGVYVYELNASISYSLKPLWSDFSERMS